MTVNTKENKDLNLDALLHGKKEEEKPANETKEETEQDASVAVEGFDMEAEEFGIGV